MKKIFLFLILNFLFLFIFSQNKNEKLILSLLNKQQNAWNKGNLDEFMQGYWESDSLMFVGKSGVTYGWQNTLNNYKKGYPDLATMGTLEFTIIRTKKIDKKNYFVVGKWFLKRTKGDIGGHFTLFFKKIKGKWKIVADHSS